jgi:hypothetical protein
MMNKRTRLFLVVAAAILVVGLGTGLVASYVGLQNLTIIGGRGPAELAYVPVDTRIVAYANVRDVMDSELRHKLDSVAPGGGDGARTFQEKTGIDVEHDIDYVLAAVLDATVDASLESGPPLVLAHGRFDPVRLEGLARQEGATVEDYKGHRLITHEMFGLAFVEPGLVVLGAPAAVKKAIDTKSAGAKNASDNDELMRLIGDVDDGTVWAVAKFDALAATRLPQEVVGKLPQISWFSAKGVIHSGIEGQVRAEARDDAAAQDLRQVIQGFMALARMQAANQPAIADFMNSMQLGGQGKTVSLSFSVPPAVIDAIGGRRALQPRVPSLPTEPPVPAPTAPEAPKAPAPPAL